MRLIFGLVLVLGLGLAGFAAYMVKSYIHGYEVALQRERAANAPAIQTVDIYVANRDLKYGEALTPKDVRLTAFPTGALPKGIFTDEKALFSKGENVPRSVLRSMEKNEPVLAVKVTNPGEDAGITSQLSRGMRAFAIKVDVASGVSGFLRPGDRVDVYWTGRIGANLSNGGGNSDVTKMIQSGVKLIAVDQAANTDMTETVIARTVTVAVAPEQVAALAQAQSTGRLSLSLVGASDDTVAQRVEIDQRKLLGIPETAPVQQAPKKEVCTIKTRRGSEVIETPIPCTN